MPTVKISDLTELATGPDAADLVVVVDQSVSQTKKIQYSNFFSAPTIGTATITTANITTGGVTTANIATGNITAELNFGDSVKANFGAGDDLQIYHDGTNSYIVDTNVASDLIIKSDLIELQASDATTFATFTEGGAVTLNYADATKIATTSTGVSVTGNVAATGNVSGVDITGTGDISGVDVTATGDITGDTVKSGNGTVAAPSISFSNHTGNGFHSYSASRWGFSVNGQRMMTTDILQSMYITGTSQADGIPLSTESWINLIPGTTKHLVCNNTLYPLVAQTNGTINGGIVNSGGTVSIFNSSDYRAKENVAPIDCGLAEINQLNPINFNYIDHPNVMHHGFLAHELQAVCEQAAYGEKDAVDDEGNPIYQTVSTTALIPILVKAVQELTARIEALEG